MNDNEIIPIIESFKDKIEDYRIECVISLIKHSEAIVGIEILFVNIYDMDMKLTEEEKNKLIEYAKWIGVGNDYIDYILEK